MDKRGGRAVASTRVKVAISVLWYSGASLSRGLMRLAGRSPSARFVVLYYHEVPKEARTRFARQMEALSRGTKVVRAGHTGPLPDGGSYVAITFDDAFRSVRTNAVPELLSRGFPATIFVPVEFLGQRPSWEMRNDGNGLDECVMTRDELQSLPELIELGSHSLSHPHLTTIDAARLREEVKHHATSWRNCLATPYRCWRFRMGNMTIAWSTRAAKPAMTGCSESIPGLPIPTDGTSFEAACRSI